MEKLQSGPIFGDALGGGPSLGHSNGPWLLVALWEVEILGGAGHPWPDAFLASGQLWSHHVHEGPYA